MKEQGQIPETVGRISKQTRDRKEKGRKLSWRRTQMIQALGVLVGLLGSIKSARKLLEGTGRLCLLLRLPLGKT